MSATLSWSDIVLRLVLTIVAGALIGLDRGEHAQPAGLRTTILIAVAASIAMLQTHWLTVHSADTHNSIVRLDMMRLPLGILSGVGFIGAGAILRRGELVRGVTTAATIWVVTVIGLCFGGGQIGLGIAGTGIALATLWGLRYVEIIVVPARRGTLTVTFASAVLPEQSLSGLLAQRGFSLRSRHIQMTPGGTTRVTCSGRYRGAYPEWSQTLMRDVVAQLDVDAVEWRDID